MKVLLELRPAFDGHSGIPQETRLLFRGLAGLPDVELAGLLQSSNLAVEPGLPMRRGLSAGRLSETQAVDRLSKVVVSLQQGAVSHWTEQLRRRVLAYLGPMGAVLLSLLGRSVSLTRFEPARFRDFLWRFLFAKSLPRADVDIVTSREFRVLRWPWSMMNAVGVVSRLVLRRALFARLDTRGFDVIIVETPYPARPHRGTRMIVRYHDAIPLLMPHTIKARGYHRATHYNALVRNASDGAWFACVSEATRQDLLSVMPELAQRAVTIPNMVSHHFREEVSDPARVPEIVWSRKSRGAPFDGGAAVAAADLQGGTLPYLLMVGTIEPRKNHLALIDGWELLRADVAPTLNLVIVGGLGWDHDDVLRRFAPWLQRGGLHLLADVPADDLRLLYRHAVATVCPSFAEGFDFPGIEAMRSGGVVAASDIPVHRAVFGEACGYFSPYAAVELAACVKALLGPEGKHRRQTLIEAGACVAKQYLPERVMPQWQALLRTVQASP